MSLSFFCNFLSAAADNIFHENVSASSSYSLIPKIIIIPISELSLDSTIWDYVWNDYWGKKNPALIFSTLLITQSDWKQNNPIYSDNAQILICLELFPYDLVKCTDKSIKTYISTRLNTYLKNILIIEELLKTCLCSW